MLLGWGALVSLYQLIDFWGNVEFALQKVRSVARVFDFLVSPKGRWITIAVGLLWIRLAGRRAAANPDRLTDLAESPASDSASSTGRSGSLVFSPSIGRTWSEAQVTVELISNANG